MTDLKLWQIVFVSNYEKSRFYNDTRNYDNFKNNELEIFEVPITSIEFYLKDWLEFIRVTLDNRFTYVDIENLYYTKEDCINWALEFKKTVLERMKSCIENMLA